MFLSKRFFHKKQTTNQNKTNKPDRPGKRKKKSPEKRDKEKGFNFLVTRDKNQTDKEETSQNIRMRKSTIGAKKKLVTPIASSNSWIKKRKASFSKPKENPP